MPAKLISKSFSEGHALPNGGLQVHGSCSSFFRHSDPLGHILHRKLEDEDAVAQAMCRDESEMIINSICCD